MAALVERAYTLNTMTKDQRSAVYEMLNAKGWRIFKPESDELAPELPQLAKTIGSEMLAAGLSRGDVARMCGFSDPGVKYIVPTARCIELRRLDA